MNNFRSHAGILKCATSVLNILLTLFPYCADVHERDVGLCKGPRTSYIQDYLPGNPLLKQLVRSNPSFALICRDHDAIESKNDLESAIMAPLSFELPPGGCTVISIQNAKGIEYDDVILLNFFCTIPSEQQRWWKRLFADMARGAEMRPETQYPQMEAQLKLLYTGITRCCNRLVFIETKRSDAGAEFFRWLSSSDLAEEVTAADVQKQGGDKFYSHDEWKLLGISRALDAADGDGALTMLDTAIKYFGNAGSDCARLKKKAEIQRSMAAERIQLLSPSGVIQGIDVDRETRWANTLEKCISEKMYYDACQLCRLVRPQLERMHNEKDFNVAPYQPLSYYIEMFESHIFSILGPLFENV